jgi:hypothetical protein
MAGNIARFPNYSTEANPASNHQERLVGPWKNDASSARSHELATGEGLPECARLVVLIPTGEIQETRLIQQVWRLASPRSVPILMLGITRDYETETGLMRRLATLAAFTRDRFVKVETRILHTANWVSALREITQPGDVILCNAEQDIAKGLFQVQPLSEVLPQSIRSPIYVLSGFCTKEPRRISEPLKQVLGWIILPLLLAGFIGLDARVVDEVSGPWQSVLLILLLTIEIGAIWLWNMWLG